MAQIETKTGRKIGSVKDTRVVYVGSERFKKLADTAIKISYIGGQQVTASQIIQYLIDNFTDAAKEQLLKEIKKD